MKLCASLYPAIVSMYIIWISEIVCWLDSQWLGKPLSQALNSWYKCLLLLMPLHACLSDVGTLQISIYDFIVVSASQLAMPKSSNSYPYAPPKWDPQWVKTLSPPNKVSLSWWKHRQSCYKVKLRVCTPNLECNTKLDPQVEFAKRGNWVKAQTYKKPANF